MKGPRLILGDCLRELAALSDDSVDAMVTDPPAGIAFMGKDWDKDKGGRKEWIGWMESVMRECLRVMKPGAHGLVWALPRTSHWTATALEDAGFEIRDCVYHIFGSGFPKSLDVSKAIDKILGNNRPKIMVPSRPGPESKGNLFGHGGIRDVSPAASAASAAWQGWGTALKPAVENWILVRKPISEKTVAANVLKWGTGALDIGGSRIEAKDQLELAKNWDRETITDIKGGSYCAGKASGQENKWKAPTGRFPSHLILDEEAAAMLDEQSGASGGGGNRKTGSQRKPRLGREQYGDMAQSHIGVDNDGDSGGASRFFYCAKTSTSERNYGVKELLTWDAQDQSLLALMAELSQLAKDISADTTLLQNDTLWSTGLYGHSISDQYPMGLMFTIKTVTKLITELKTSNFSQSLNTNVSILDVIRMIEANGLSLAESVAFLNQLNLSSTDDATASVLGANRAVLPTLSKISACAKRGNTHPTLKPQKLMRYLIKLITPPGGTVLDPFMGSGSTGLAAKTDHFEFIGIEREKEYLEIAEKRIANSQWNLI